VGCETPERVCEIANSGGVFARDKPSKLLREKTVTFP
jgi:hypothetical protein